ncbi:lipase family protein [Occultella kanbiaonis]|uniref:lipase family protein n=1 Tax=Occultella kanbiaonis TaxID=2675754 RepID=UPI0013D6ED7B|nr:lipase family protein [Occultella kanbiaonis]
MTAGTEQARRWRPLDPQSAPPAVAGVVGALMVLLGVVLITVASGAGIHLLVGLVAAGLVLAGVARYLQAGGSSIARVDVVLAVLLVGLGAFVVLWRGLTLPGLVTVVSVALAASGIAGIVGAIRGTRAARAGAAFAGVAALLFAALAQAWPVLTVLAVGVIFGAFLVYAGLVLGIPAALAMVRRRQGSDDSGASPQRRPAGRLRRGGALVVGIAALLVAVLLAGGTYWLRAGGPEVVPDGFYTPPIAVPDAPGQLLRIEPLSSGVPPGADGWRILYTTTHADGSPAVASGTVIAPAERTAEALPVVSVAHGTTGIVPRCAPSLAPAPFGGGAGAALEDMVAQGWAGVLTDYVGLGTAGPHPYLVGEEAGRDVLDALRAAHQIEGLALSDTTAVWGHSQGGHGALWTAIVAPEYAPEFTIVGVAAMAPATDLYRLAAGIKDEVAGKVVSAYIAASWAQYYPELGVDDVLTPGTESVVERIGALCFEGRDALAAGVAASQLFDPVFVDEALDGALGTALRDNSPTDLIDVPVLVAQGDADTLVLPSMQRTWVSAQCAAGQSLDYREYTGLDHLSLVAADSALTDELVEWTSARLDGADPTPTC